MAQTFLITGAGTGFGREIALRLAAQGHDVIAGVEIVAQVASLRSEAAARGAELRVEKLDVTDERDRERARTWGVDVLLNNAGISEGGATIDIPEERIRRQFEVNVFGTVLLTQGIAREMVTKGGGRIVFVSSVAGLTTDPFTGAYAASKHAIEAFADALDQELAEHGVTVATINPGPYLTGFNDTMFETWKQWPAGEEAPLFDYSEISFPHEQYDPESVYETTLNVLTGEDQRYRHVLPPEVDEQARGQVAAQWERTVNDGSRPALVQKAYDMRPAVPVEE